MIWWYQNGSYCLTTNEKYSVNKSYNALLGNVQRPKVAELIWSAVLIPRNRFIMWLANQDRLFIKERLSRLQIPINSKICSICKVDKEETQRHLFSECDWTSKLQDRLESWSGIIMQMKQVTQWLQWINGRHWRQFKKEIASTVLGAGIYHIWQARNWKLFKETTINTEQIVTQVKIEIRGRIDLMKDSKRARKCRYRVKRLSN